MPEGYIVRYLNKSNRITGLSSSWVKRVKELRCVCVRHYRHWDACYISHVSLIQASVISSMQVCGAGVTILPFAATDLKLW